MEDIEYQPVEIIIEKEEIAYGFIIEVLTSGLYPNKYHVIREYVQNAFDAIVSHRRRTGENRYGRIDVKVASPSIFVFDDGIGMDRNKMNQYRYVGYSEKRTGEGVGFRGIGKLSGISVAEKLIITSSPSGLPERYKLVFNADDMLNHIISLKIRGDNIPLNDLINEHTQITTEEEETDKHYTLVELFKVREDSLLLLDEEALETYLSMNAPVEFDPDFHHGSTIDNWLRDYVPDYDTVLLNLNGKKVLKPYLPNLKQPRMDFLLEEDDDESADPIAFYWHCEHGNKGQLSDNEKRGLFFRLKNFAIGTNYLTRNNLWRSSPERAFYFFGEVHICDPAIVPSSSRDDFEQNRARERLYFHGKEIGSKLNRIAGTSSDRRRAREFILRAEEIVGSVEKELESGEIPQELQYDKYAHVQEAVREANKRIRKATKVFQKRGDSVVERGGKLLEKLKNDEATVSKTFDITKALKFNSQANEVYGVIIECLKEELGEMEGLFEKVLQRIHLRLKESMGKR